MVFNLRVKRSALPSPELLAAYQSPPTQLLIEDNGAWLTPLEVQNLRGDFFVITPDNPASRLFTEKRNAARRSSLQSQIKKRRITSAPTRARNLQGVWPDEQGFALWGLELPMAHTISRRWGQFAFYLVDVEGVKVIATKPVGLFARGEYDSN